VVTLLDCIGALPFIPSACANLAQAPTVKNAAGYIAWPISYRDRRMPALQDLDREYPGAFYLKIEVFCDVLWGAGGRGRYFRE
jgi:hypothetical protein